MSYGGTSTSVTVPAKPSPDGHACACHAPAKAEAHACECHDEPEAKAAAVTTSALAKPSKNGFPTLSNGHPDFARMDVGQRLAYHRERLGLGR